MKCICVVTGVDIWGSNRYMISDGQNNGLNDSNVMYMYREQKPSLEKKILCNDPCSNLSIQSIWSESRSISALLLPHFYFMFMQFDFQTIIV